jgi:ABC-type transport system involved in multi-copper enzyme maturation permease subunit
MMWVVWRQQRSIVVAFVAAMVVFALWLIITGQHEQSLWNQFLGAPCKGGYGFTSSDGHFCRGLQNAVYSGAHIDDVATVIGTAFAPLFGLILGVNAVAREIEQKTNRLAWTQSGSRSKWLASKYITSVATIVIVSAPLCLVLSWWVRASHVGPRITPKAFPVAGVVEISYGVFCFVLAVGIGLVIRRAGWSLAVCIILFGALFFSFANQVRPYLVTRSVTSQQGTGIEEGSSSGFYSPAGAPSNSWFFYQGYEPKTTKGVPSPVLLVKPTNAFYRCDAQGSQQSSCLRRLHLRFIEVYMSDSRFWTLQSLEGLFYVGLSVLLAGLTFLGIRRTKA